MPRAFLESVATLIAKPRILSNWKRTLLSTEHGPFRDVARGFGWEPSEAGLVAARQGGRGELRVSPLCALFGRR